MTKWLLALGLCLVWFAVPVATAVARDRDRDGLPDRWERRYGLSTQSRSATGDPDHDGLANRREYRRHTNPRRRDTDRDGLRDGTEVKRYHTNPRKRDTDGDGLNDRVEIKRHHTNPRKRDTDGDGVSDGAEVRAGTDPLNRSSHPPGQSVPPGTSPPPAAGQPGAIPSPSTTGVPAGWLPAQTRTSDLRVTQAGAVVQDVLMQNANIIVDAPNVTLRRVKLQGGVINNFPGSTCANGLVIENSTLEPAPGATRGNDTEGVVSYGGYTARRVLIQNRSEGFRVGGSPACGPVTIEDSFARITSPIGCNGDSWHGDGVQGYGGNAVTIRNDTFVLVEDLCHGTAPFFYPRNQGNTSATIDRLLVMGGGYPFRLGMPGTVSGLKIVNGSWIFGPIDVNCAAIRSWNAAIVTITPDFKVASTVRSQPCNSQGGN
jgi:hypothetical protein